MVFIFGWVLEKLPYQSNSWATSWLEQQFGSDAGLWWFRGRVSAIDVYGSSCLLVRYRELKEPWGAGANSFVNACLATKDCEGDEVLSIDVCMRERAQVR